MRLHDLIDATYARFRRHCDEARVILLHPRSRYRSVLVAQLMRSDELKVFYYAFGPDDISVESLLAGMKHALTNQKPTFGRHLNLLSSEEQGHAETLLATTVRDLAELHDQPFFLILDEYDRCDTADDIQLFMERLVPLLPDHCRLIINSRTLPRLPWVSMIARRSAIILEDDVMLREDFYEFPKSGKDQLEVYALGPGFVLLNGRPIETWEGHLPRLLFFFALDKPIITRTEICQAFWPELDNDQAVNVFHVTKRRLHKALDADVLVHEEGYYRINPEMGIEYDVLYFVEALMEARDEHNPSRLKAWQRAIDFYRGPFLQSHPDRWIADRRGDFRAGYLEALLAVAHARMDEGKPETALGLLQRAIHEDYSRVDVHREVMRLYTTLGRRSEAAAHFQRYVDEMGKQQREPDGETASLYEAIMA